VVSHVDPWERFLQQAEDKDRWSVFLETYYGPNRDYLDALLKKIGVENPESHLRKNAASLDLEGARQNLDRVREKKIIELVDESVRRSFVLLPTADLKEGSIHLWMLFSMFSGMGLVIANQPTVVLDGNSLATTEPVHVRILTAHELNHAVRWSYVGDPVPAGLFLDLQVKDSLLAEGLAIAFSESVFPGRSLEEYIPYYTYNPEKLPGVEKQETAIREHLLAHLEEKIAAPEVRDYFYGAGPDDMSSRLRNSAYYIGYGMVKELMRRGHGIDELTRLPTDELLRRYQNP
jgi:hypothetical protein